MVVRQTDIHEDSRAGSRVDGSALLRRTSGRVGWVWLARSERQVEPERFIEVRT